MLLNYKQKLIVGDLTKYLDTEKFSVVFEELFLKWELKKFGNHFKCVINDDKIIDYEIGYDIFDVFKNTTDYPEILPKKEF